MLFQLGYDAQEVRKRSPEPVKFTDNQGLALFRVFEAGLQAWAIIARFRSLSELTWRASKPTVNRASRRRLTDCRSSRRACPDEHFPTNPSLSYTELKRRGLSCKFRLRISRPLMPVPVRNHVISDGIRSAPETMGGPPELRQTTDGWDSCHSEGDTWAPNGEERQLTDCTWPPSIR